MIDANRALQRSSDVPIVDISGMFARLGLAQGPVMIAANQGRYDLDTQKVAIDGPVRVAGPDGYRLETRDVHGRPEAAPAGQRTGRSPGRCGSASSRRASCSADLGERTVVLDGGARLKIVQGAVR